MCAGVVRGYDVPRSNPNGVAHHSHPLRVWRYMYSLAAFDEDFCQPFRFADHEAVTGVDFDERLHSADRVDALVLRLIERARSRGVRIHVRGTSSGISHRVRFRSRWVGTPDSTDRS